MIALTGAARYNRPMSLEAKLKSATESGALLESSHQNILALLAGTTNPAYRAAIEELTKAGQWAELNDRFFQTLKFGTGGLRGRTIGKIVTKAERGKAKKGERPNLPCVGTNAMNHFNVSRATRGLVAYILNYRAKKKLKGRPSIVIAHDTRHFSKEFAKFAAKLAIEHGADAHRLAQSRA